jgi:hypothetical protein
MRFILVNGRKPKDTETCVFCPANIGESYVRDCATGLHYCSHWCLEAHIFASERAFTTPAIQLIEHRRPL